MFRRAEHSGATDATDLETQCVRLRDFFAQKAGVSFPTDPWQMLTAAVNAVFRSWHSERAILYRKHHQINGLLGTAVNVQMMCPSEVSGVMFTANPVNQAGEIIIESAFGLGEAIVLGKVTPDRFVLDKTDLTTKERVISRKENRIATLAEDGHGQTGAKDDASLGDDQVRALAELGHASKRISRRRAISNGLVALLAGCKLRHQRISGADDQSAVERENVRAEEGANLQPLAELGGTVWS